MLNKTVMIIDDDEDDRMLFGEALLIAAPDTRLMTASDGEKALKVLQELTTFLPDFIFLDLNMPKMSGWQCLQHIRKIALLKYTPVVIFSTSKETDFENILLPDDVYFFTKPPKFNFLVNGLRHIFDHQWQAIKELNKGAYV